MSGQYPHQVGGAPVTMNNFSNWNQPPHQQAQGRGVPTNIAQNTTLSNMPQPHMQVPGSPTSGMKFSNIVHNGSGSPLPGSITNQNSQATLSDNLRQNFHIFMNQTSGQSPPKGAAVTPPITPATVPNPSIDLSQSPQMADKMQSTGALPVSPQANESSMTSQKHSVISSVGTSTPFNGDVHTKTSNALSVIANTSVSPSSRLPAVPNQGAVVYGQPEDSKAGLAVPEIPTIKIEPQTVVDIPGNVSAKLNVPPIKVKEENVPSVTSTVGSTNSLMSSSVSPGSQEQVCNKGPTVNQPSMPVPSSSSKQDALDVESQLEALFAGIADEDKPSKDSKPLPEPSADLQGTPNVVAVLESKGSSSKKGKGKTNGLSKPSEGGKYPSSESTPKKKRKKKTVKPWEEDMKNKKSKKSTSNKGKYVKEASCDSGSNASSSRIRGPVVHVEGTKEAPTSLSVINAPSRQDDEDNDSKKKASSSSRPRKIHTIEGKPSSNGLCGNSLVTRYEAHSSDPRWVCVFCKQGCHVDGLGDLFGPYLVSHDTELENSLDMDAEMDRKSGDKKDKKGKRSGIGQTGVLGLLAIPPLPGEQPHFMVYFHEKCAVWSPSINLIGSRLAGVQEAIWVAVRSKCSRCLMDGANIGCVHHGCSLQLHYPCARATNWCLDENTFISTCHIHKKPEQTPQILSAVPIL